MADYDDYGRPPRGTGGYEEVADLEDASDAELLQLGLRNVECRRLRRYLAAPEQNRPP